MDEQFQDANMNEQQKGIGKSIMNKKKGKNRQSVEELNRDGERAADKSNQLQNFITDENFYWPTICQHLLLDLLLLHEEQRFFILLSKFEN